MFDGFVVRFYPKSGELFDEYFYAHIEDAFYHFNLFRDDTSDLYRKIEIIADLPEQHVIASMQF